MEGEEDGQDGRPPDFELATSHWRTVDGENGTEAKRVYAIM